MKRIITIFLTVFAAFSAYCQTCIQDGDHCFDSGDYACAVTQYNEAFKNASYKDKQTAEIRLSRAKWCAEHIKVANQEFNNKNYSTAKDEYQKVLDTNPKDSYAQSLLEKCNTALNSAATANNSANRPNKRTTTPKQTVSTLAVSDKRITFAASGGKTIIGIATNASDYQITLLPSWCKVGNKYDKWFSLNCNANTGAERESWFKIIADGKEVKVYVEQSANAKFKTRNDQIIK
ncbi:MAG: BACON domain-containing protein [Prevotellaceae bacterium]|jgi:hypothetical protein|nr:BACON domain-containing protein [Prevotellaceae bacterium]